jgi:hypothetical protein
MFDRPTLHTAGLQEPLQYSIEPLMLLVRTPMDFEVLKRLEA